jgi:hypothetical protein
MNPILDNTLISYNELKVGNFINNDGYFLKEFSGDNHLFCIYDTSLYIREQANKTRYSVVFTKNGFQEYTVLIYAIIFTESKYAITISNNKIPIGTAIGNIGIIKCNDTIFYNFIFDANDMDNKYFILTEEKVLHIKPQYSTIPSEYKILIEINNMITVMHIECYRPTLVLSNNYIELDINCTKVGKFVISDISTKYAMRIIDNDNLYIENDELYIKKDIGISVHDITVEIISNVNIFTYQFQIFAIPFIYLTNNNVNIDQNEMFIGYIENNNSNIECIYTLCNSDDNQYFEIVDMNRLMVNKIPDYRNTNIYTISIMCKFIIDDNEINYVKNTFIYVFFNEISNTDLNIIIDDRKKTRYEFSSQLSDTVQFTITSINNPRKLRLIMISGGEICVGNSRKLDIDEYILMFKDYKYHFKYTNRNIGNNKLLFYIIDGQDKQYSTLEIYINVNDTLYHNVNALNIENIIKFTNTTTINSLNPDIPKSFNVQIFKLNPGVDIQHISKRLNNCQIIYNTNKNKCRHNNYLSLVIQPITLTGYMSNMNAIYVKCINNYTGESSINSENPMIITLHLPNYRAAKNLYAYSMHDCLSGFDGRFLTLVPLQHSYQNVYFNLTLDGSSSTYVISDNSVAPKCFLSGTNILTSNGYQIIDNLKIGDKIITHDFRDIEILDICKVIVPSNKTNDPYLISSGSFGAISDLYLSPLHQILIEDKFVCVKQLDNVQQVFVSFTLEYYHIKTADYFRDTIVAEGVITETWSGIDPLDFELTRESEFITKFNTVKIDNYSRKILV